MRKIATLALAAALSIAALAPAAFAKQGDCSGKEFAAHIQAAQQEGKRGQDKKGQAVGLCESAGTPPPLGCFVCP